MCVEHSADKSKGYHQIQMLAISEQWWLRFNNYWFDNKL